LSAKLASERISDSCPAGLIAPVAVADLQIVLDRDLAEALKSGELAPGTGAGVSIAVVEHGVRRVFSYGAAKPNSIFEIGSITKTFTGLVLSQMVEQRKVKFDEPVRELLPPGTVAKPVGPEITLLDLATQKSGLPRMPDNFKPADPNNPYADYVAPNLYAFMAQHGVAKPGDPGFLYSNLGFGLLSQALAVRSGLPYPVLLKEEAIDPLGLKDTTVSFPPRNEPASSRVMTNIITPHTPGIWMPSPEREPSARLRLTCSPIWKQICIPKSSSRLPVLRPGPHSQLLSYSRISFARTRCRECASLSHGSL
jgi:CubicO group peptidase (beta-lactamase class C family)